MKKISALLLGIREFRRDITTGFVRPDGGTDWDMLEVYDFGRDLAHRLTFRLWDDMC